MEVIRRLPCSAVVLFLFDRTGDRTTGCDRMTPSVAVLRTQWTPQFRCRLSHGLFSLCSHNGSSPITMLDRITASIGIKRGRTAAAQISCQRGGRPALYGRIVEKDLPFLQGGSSSVALVTFRSWNVDFSVDGTRFEAFINAI